jgi:uncharacterized membrane protein YagU involved in acid resistance
MSATTTPLRALARGIAAGLGGTAAMTGWQELSARLRSSGTPDAGGEDPPADPWEQAPVPAQVARRIVEGVLQRPLAPERIGLATNVMHWAYGTGWAVVYGMLSGSTATPGGPRRGIVFGTGVWAMSYVQLVPLGLYEPPWKYPLEDLAMDLSYHLAYGVGVSTTDRLLHRG